MGGISRLWAGGVELFGFGDNPVHKGSETGEGAK